MPKIEPIRPIPTDIDLSNLSSLRLDQSFLETGGAKKILSTVPVRKPHKQHFIRVHPEPEFRKPFAVIELEKDREHYLVTPPIAAALPAEIVSVMLYTAERTIYPSQNGRRITRSTICCVLHSANALSAVSTTRC
jgi:hypothetical protein